MIDPKYFDTKDLSHLVSYKEPIVQAVPYKGERLQAFGNTGPIRLFMIVSILPQDHAVEYIYFCNDTTIELAEKFIKANMNLYGDNVVVIDTGMAFNNDEEVQENAKIIKKYAPNSEVLIPAIILETVDK